MPNPKPAKHNNNNTPYAILDGGASFQELVQIGLFVSFGVAISSLNLTFPFAKLS